MGRPRVSIVTPSYNQAPFIERTLRSVLCQDYCNVEYIVMDGASTDGTREILANYESNLDILVSEPDAGQSDALNKGFARASGDILAYLNSDDCYASAQVISSVIAYFQANPDVDVVYGRRYTIGADGQLAHFLPYRSFSANMLRQVCYIPQEATFWTRRLYERVGGVIDTTFDFAMDYDLWLRFLRGGARFMAVPEFYGLFRYYPDQKTAARWQTKGLPEIARLQREHLGRDMPEQEMMDYHAEYFYGANPSHQSDAHTCFAHFWEPMLSRSVQRLNRTRLDGWVDSAPIHASHMRAKLVA